MGEKTEFEPGDKAPNDGEYTEVGEKSFVTEIQNPKRVTLQKVKLSPKQAIIIASGRS